MKERYCSKVPPHMNNFVDKDEEQHHHDQTPIKPSRRSWRLEEEDGNETIETESYQSCQFLFSSGQETSDDDSVISDVTDPSAFGLDDSYRLHFGNSWRQESLGTSFRIAALGPLFEDIGERHSFEDRNKDKPPQPVVRQASSRGLIIKDDSTFDDLPPGQQGRSITVTKTSSAQLQSKPALSSLPKLAKAFVFDCPVGTHLFHLKKYPNTFVGSQAVDFMLSAGLASTREDAVFLGQRFDKELSLFHHVSWDHTFKDGRFLYVFNEDFFRNEQCGTSREKPVSVIAKFAEGMHVSKHTGRFFKTYQNTFSGEEAVKYMLQSKLALNRPHAILLGQRMMEELQIFHPVAHRSRFKDSHLLFRFVTTDSTAGDSSFDESSGSMSFQLETDCVQRKQNTRRSRLPTARPTHFTVDRKQGNFKVSFGLVQSRSFERRLDYNPATTSGPSLSLGWRFYDESPVPLSDANATEASKPHGGRLSIKDRSKILNEWGYTTVDINRATRLNKKLRQRRNQSLNNDRIASSI
ncbi:unnamed protein product [Cylindrotheca closterium]|uniref:DEP domain-containing protein n=1 Tax=Cylindrotheca closterium TaxID=2856 RepID=A0AAD2JLA1_9STRA|nr:unnamed protein product [Cylindrotheca closterium]